MPNQTKQFVKGALLLSLAGILTKVINMFFKVPLQAIIGDEGLAFYYNPYPIYTIFIAIFITGISSAISKTVSGKLALGRYREAHTIFRYMMWILIVLGGLSSIALFLFAEGIVSLAGWAPETVYALKGMSISPIFLAVVGGIRGYFQGMQNMTPPAFSQVFESLGKVIFGIGLVVMFLMLGYDVGGAAGGAALGLSIGVFMSMIFLLIVYGRHRKFLVTKMAEDRKSEEVLIGTIMRSILTVAIPIAIGAACYTVMNAIDSFTIVRQLKAIGFDYVAANEMMGQKIKADTFINIPMVISVSLVISILPAISEAVVLGNKQQLKEKIDIASKLAYLVALPASVGIFILAEPLLKLFFFSNASGGQLLAIYSFSILFVIMAQTYTAVLQGIGSVYRPVINLAIAAAIKLLLNMLLINQELLINGAVISSVVAYAILAILNYIAVHKRTSYGLNVAFICKGLASTIIMGVATFLVFKGMQQVSQLVIMQIGISVIIAVGIYGLCIILTRALGKDDYAYIPLGSKLYAIIDKLIYRGR